METIGNYLLQMSCWITAFWLVYILLLKKETYFELNRWFLNTGLVLSFVMPLLPVSYKVYQAVQPLSASIIQATQLTIVDTPTTVNYWLFAYLSGVLFFIVRFFVQHFNLYRMRKRSSSISIDSLKVYRIEKEAAPFSFFNRIYVSSKFISDIELKTVVAHEKVHIHERHWADLLLLEVVRTLQWFNPLLQLYRKAIMQNHEFLADSGTIEHGVSAHTYRAILANQMLGIPVVSFANSFTFFNSSNRILMMKKDKSTPIKRLKLLLILPLISLILVGFAKPNYVIERNSNTSLSEEAISIRGKVFDMYGHLIGGVEVSTISKGTSAISDENGEFTLNDFKDKNDISAKKDGYSYSNTILNDNILTVLMSIPNGQAKESNVVKGKVTDQNGDPIAHANVVAVNDDGKFISGVTTDQNGNYILKTKVKATKIIASYIGYERISLIPKEELNFEMKQHELMTINVKQLEPMKIKGKVLDEEGNSLPAASVSVYKGTKGTLSDKNGDFKLEYVKSDDKIRVSFVGYETIVSPVKKKMTFNMVRSVIAIEVEQKMTTPPPPPPPPASALEFRSKDGKTPLILIDGEITKFDIMQIDQETIESIEVLKDEAATALYGDKGKDGVILISTKKDIKAKEKSNEEVFIVVEDMPKYPGGESALKQYIQAEASKVKIDGSAIVSFIIDTKGSTTNVRIAKSSSEKLNEPAEKIVKGMPDWSPGMQRGKPVKVNYTVKIEFNN